jgi:membrane protein
MQGLRDRFLPDLLGNPVVGAVRRFQAALMEDDVFGLSAELAYRFMFATFPFAIFLTALSAFIAQWLGIQDPASQIIDRLGTNLPADVAGPIRYQLDAILATTQPALLSGGAVLTLWAASGATTALMKAMNRVFDVRESRPLVRRYLVSLALTVLGGLGMLASSIVVVGGELLTRQVVEQLGLGSVWSMVAWLRWPILFAALVVVMAAILWLAPNCRPPWRWSALGSAVFAVSWLVMTFVFGVYVARFGHFDVTYGALAGAIVLMLWFYLTAFLLVASTEVVALAIERERAVVSEAGVQQDR